MFSMPSDGLGIGGVQVPNRVFLAPMSGVTDAPFRRLVAELGAGLVFSEMTASSALLSGEDEARLRVERHGVGHHVVQLAGCIPEWMAEAARMAEAAGADIIDINMGCPAKRVINGQAGSALMRDLDHALRLIDATVDAVSIPVTVKMRLGWDAHTINAPELARRAHASGVRLLTVHGRTRNQFYDGAVDAEAIAAVTRAVSIPVIANGDINTVADAERMLARSQAAGVMIGRGAQGRPWLPGQLARYLATGIREPEPDLATQWRLVAGLYEALLSHYGWGVGLRHARKHLGWALNVAAATARAPVDRLRELRARVLTATDPKEVLRGLGEAFDALGAAA